MEDAQKVSPRPVTFDLMSKDPDYYFVLTEALREFAARQYAEAEEAEDNGDWNSRIQWAQTAEAMLDKTDKAVSTPVMIRQT